MTTAIDVESITLRVAEIMIEELKLEDVTPATFDPEIDLIDEVGIDLSLIHISEPTRPRLVSRMPSSA